jgi:predicted short-subunit dehydrogenase-like oxidoreductase (DUF2520 family)
MTKVLIKNYEQCLSGSDIVIFTVPDRHISSVCSELTPHLHPAKNRNKKVILHCSGALNSDVLISAKEVGCETASAHPLNTFPNLDDALKLFSNTQHATHLFCEGSKIALKQVDTLFTSVGFHLHTIEKHNKVLYHTACVFICNYLTVLIDMSLRIGEKAEIDSNTFWRASQPVVNATLANIHQNGPSAALSGPIVRGDSDTINKQLQQLTAIMDESQQPIVAAYLSLAEHGIALGEQKARKSSAVPPDFQAIKELINSFKR